MYLERFEAEGSLDLDGARRLSLVAAQHGSRMYVTVGERRALAQNLPHCWRDLGIAPGVIVTVEATHAAGASEDEHRAIVAFGRAFADVTRRTVVPQGRR